jgi:hypothetical protein
MALIVLLVLVILLALGALSFAGQYDRLAVVPVEVARFGARYSVAPSASADVLVARYLTRHRSYRYGGGIIGFVAAIVIAVVRPGPFRLGIGFVDFPDILVCTLGGVLAGVVVAESYHLRRRAVPGALVSLEPRDVARFADPSGIARIRLCVAVSIVAFAAAGPHDDGSAIACVVLSVVVAVMVDVEQRMIARRPRPALPVDLQAADDAIRRATCSVALNHAGQGVTMLLLGSQLTAQSAGSVVELVGLLNLGLFIGAIVAWRRSRVWTA